MLNKLDAYLRNATDSGTVPGIVALVESKGERLLCKAYGQKRIEPYTEPMATDTVFDIASLTKLVATWMSIIHLIGEGALSFDATLGALFQAPIHRYKDVTIAQLLKHTSGLPAHLYVSTLGDTHQDITINILGAEPLYAPDTQVTYSDLGFILLGFIVEQISDKPLDAYCRPLWDKMDMHNTMFCPSQTLHPRIAPTEWNESRQDYKLGIVHDENGEALHGVAGAAGVFSTADDLAKFCRMVQADGTYNDQSILLPELVRASRIDYTPGLDDERSYGWAVYKNAFEEEMIGHTGFTGTTLYMDKKRDIIYVLLSNRVHPRRELYGEAMQRIRKESRDILWQELPE